ARRPCTQPRQLSCAMATVMSETVAPRHTKNTYRYLRVSALRRAMKLMSWTTTRFPTGTPAASSGRTETSSGPVALSNRCPGEPENLSRSEHRIWEGSVDVITGWPALEGQYPIANRQIGRAHV